MMRRHRLAIVAAVVAATAVAGGAYAATQTASNPHQAFLNDVAKRLHVTPAQLHAALKGASIDRLNAAVKAGRLTQAQANAIEKQIESGRPAGALGFGRPAGPLGFGPPPGALGFGQRRFHFFGRPGQLDPAGPLGAVANYLGLRVPQLFEDLSSGKTLAQIARAQGKSVSGLERAIESATKSRLDRAVSAGFLTKAQEQRLLSRESARLPQWIQQGILPLLHRHYLRPAGAPPAPSAVPAPAGGPLPAPGI